MADETKPELRILGPEDIGGLSDTYPRELVEVPEWDGAVWVWSMNLSGVKALWEEMQQGENDVERQNRSNVARVLEAVRTKGELTGDGELPPPLFDRGKHWKWLSNQPLAVIRRICEASERMNGEASVSQEALLGFFGTLTRVVSCLRHIASACECCTDCPRSSTDACPLVYSQRQ